MYSSIGAPVTRPGWPWRRIGGSSGYGGHEGTGGASRGEGSRATVDREEVRGREEESKEGHTRERQEESEIWCDRASCWLRTKCFSIELATGRNQQAWDRIGRVERGDC
eukprot:754452-Hanusia_phi.AAC.14